MATNNICNCVICACRSARMKIQCLLENNKYWAISVSGGDCKFHERKKKGRSAVKIYIVIVVLKARKTATNGFQIFDLIANRGRTEKMLNEKLWWTWTHFVPLCRRLSMLCNRIETTEKCLLLFINEKKQRQTHGWIVGYVSLWEIDELTRENEKHVIQNSSAFFRLLSARR